MNLNLSIHEHTQMKVSWRLPENATCIRFYYIRWYMKNCDIEKRKANDGQIIGTSNIHKLLANFIRIHNLFRFVIFRILF